MREQTTRIAGLLVAALYATIVGWLYARQPQTMAQVTGGLSDAIGMYRVDGRAFDDGLRFFYSEQFPEARMAFARADPAVRDARTQFYIAYAYYRQGWGHLYHDDRLYRDGLDAVNRAMALAPAGRLEIDDERLAMHSAEELKVELEAGLRRDASDFNPMRILRERK